jgi:transposase-like protein
MRIVPGQLSLDEALEDVRPPCPSCTSEDTVCLGTDQVDSGADRWACSLCGRHFLVVIR